MRRRSGPQPALSLADALAVVRADRESDMDRLAWLAERFGYGADLARLVADAKAVRERRRSGSWS